jgi:hypothetical protein
VMPPAVVAGDGFELAVPDAHVIACRRVERLALGLQRVRASLRSRTIQDPRSHGFSRAQEARPSRHFYERFERFPSAEPRSTNRFRKDNPTARGMQCRTRDGQSVGGNASKKYRCSGRIVGRPAALVVA